MNAVQQILVVNQSQAVYLTDGIKRAIFWYVLKRQVIVQRRKLTRIFRQDLNSSVMAKSKRIVDHTTFPELQWRRNPLTPSDFVLQAGFQAVSHLFTREFIEVLEDIHALQCIRDSSHVAASDAVSMAQIDNHQASIQSRLVNMPETSGFVDCCRLGAFLCSAVLRCKLWPASMLSVSVPQTFNAYVLSLAYQIALFFAHTYQMRLTHGCPADFAKQPFLSTRLLHQLQKSSSDPMWDAHSDIVVWLLVVGGAFTSEKSVRSHYIALLRSHYSTRCVRRYQSRKQLLEILRRFIWSEKGFLSQVVSFLKEVDV